MLNILFIVQRMLRRKLSHNNAEVEMHPCVRQVCNLSKRDLQSLDFTVNRFFMKLFCTKDVSVIKCCQQMFHVELPSDVIIKRLVKFESTCLLVKFILFIFS